MSEHWSSPNGCHPDCPACAAEEKHDTDCSSRTGGMCDCVALIPGAYPENDEADALRAEWEHEVGEHNCTLTFEQWKAQRGVAIEDQHCNVPEHTPPVPDESRFPDWQYQVSNGDTRLGFAEWCEHNPK